MSVKALDRVWDFSLSRGAARLVLLALADWADDEGFCYPGLVAIAAKARLSKAAVVLALKRLEADGEIRITVRGHAQPDPVKDNFRRPGGWQPTNYYQVTPAGKVVQSVDRPRKRTGGPIHETKVVQSIVKGGPIGATHIRNEPSLDPSIEPSVLKAGALPRLPPEDTPDDNLNVITKLAHTLLDVLGLPKAADEIGEYTDALKQRCAEHHVRYDSDVVRKALDSAIWQRSSRHRRPA